MTTMTRTFRLRPRTCRKLEAQGTPFLVPGLDFFYERMVSRKTHFEMMQRRRSSREVYE